MKAIKLALLVSVACLSPSFVRAQNAAPGPFAPSQPLCTWQYSLVNGQATATYCGNVVINGSVAFPLSASAIISALGFLPLGPQSSINTAQIFPPLNPIATQGLIPQNLQSHLNNSGATFGQYTPPYGTQQIYVTLKGTGGGGAGTGSGAGAGTSGGNSTFDPVAQITASQTGNTLTVSNVSFGVLFSGQTVYSTGTAETITGYGTGGGNTGTYTVSVSQTLAAQNMTAIQAGAFMAANGGAGGSGTNGGNTGGGCTNAAYQFGSGAYQIFPLNGSEISLTGEWGMNPYPNAAAATPGGNGGGEGHGTGGNGNAAGNGTFRPGAGGGGAGGSSTTTPGGGGQQGCTVSRVIQIPNPAAPPTFAWVSGSAGTGGAAGTGGFAGGAGGNGLVYVEAR